MKPLTNHLGMLADTTSSDVTITTYRHVLFDICHISGIRLPSHDLSKSKELGNCCQ